MMIGKTSSRQVETRIISARVTCFIIPSIALGDYLRSLALLISALRVPRMPRFVITRLSDEELIQGLFVFWETKLKRGRRS